MWSRSLISKRMSRPVLRAAQRTQTIARHMSTDAPQQPPVVFESLLSTRVYRLNRPQKLNALDTTMIGLVRSKAEEWSQSDLCGVIWGSGEGRAFCAGGDVAGVVSDASNSETRPKAVEFFRREFELDYILGALKKPYVAIMDGITMGGGVGLSINASFRVATENTQFAMPEVKIGYSPDVGASFFMSRLDGELGTYLALTGETIRGRAVFPVSEHGIATHYIPAKRIPMLLESVSAVENPTFDQVNQLIEENVSEPEHPGRFESDFVGVKRFFLDYAFRHDKVEDIYGALEEIKKSTEGDISEWASKTISHLNMRSPTSLKVALRAIRAGRSMNLLEALKMEFNIAAAYCNGASPDFKTGVTAVIVEKKTKERPQWNPATLEEVTDEIVDRFFSSESEYLQGTREFSMPAEFLNNNDPSKYALPTQQSIHDMVTGAHKSSGGTGLMLDELVSNFENMYGNKIGVREKVLEVADRKCKVVDNADGNNVWLKWNYTV
ncbi:hypothetical protein D9758_000876 [Tetrapyrgos nigripes]|uniref:3-hydroxyisobutyryl-CoA hydrolase n=1 Tax=Tetrapyrgos nigripes TaxID=182062 RepID=A0A8H5GZ03_9AGAR|nr:hypothetical protein D9758_000876 [Tetrapyrgos nigripes]